MHTDDQVPCGPDNEMCHRLWELCSKVCYDPVTRVRCKLWKKFSGKDATGSDCNGYFCVDEMQVAMTMEVANQTRISKDASVEVRDAIVGAAQQALLRRKDDYVQLGK